MRCMMRVACIVRTGGRRCTSVNVNVNVNNTCAGERAVVQCWMAVWHARQRRAWVAGGGEGWGGDQGGGHATASSLRRSPGVVMSSYPFAMSWSGSSHRSSHSTIAISTLHTTHARLRATLTDACSPPRTQLWHPTCPQPAAQPAAHEAGASAVAGGYAAQRLVLEPACITEGGLVTRT